MIILPAIDLKGGVCVRLRQGRADDVTTYNDDPAAQARDWRDQGGRELHVVDLDGAFAGTPRHADVIRTIIAAFGVAAGATRAIIGSAALEDPAFLTRAVEQYGDRVAVGIDARGGFVQTRGWVTTTQVKAVDLARTVAEIGVKTIIYTDTATDGMLGGPNLEQMAAICDADHRLRRRVVPARRREPDCPRPSQPARRHRRKGALRRTYHFERDERCCRLPRLKRLKTD